MQVLLALEVARKVMHFLTEYPLQNTEETTFMIIALGMQTAH